MSPWHSACIGPPVLLEPEFRPRTEAWTDPPVKRRKEDSFEWSNRPTLWQHMDTTSILSTLSTPQYQSCCAAHRLILQNTLAPVRVTIWIHAESKWRCVDVYFDVLRMCRRLNFARQSLMTLPRHPLSGASEASALALNCPETFFLLLGFPRQGSWTSFPHL